jgi:hypothetical protein
MTEHLIIIIDNNNKVEPMKYSVEDSLFTKKDAIEHAKKLYESKYKNFNYKSYYFKHSN